MRGSAARIAAALAAIVAVAVSGCGFHGVYSLPLPGAEANGAHTYTVGVQLADVLDLVPYSAVKVNNATVGHVSSIKVQGSHALVSCRLLDRVRLPANAVARVEQTSVLGEKFVQIEPPSTTVLSCCRTVAARWLIPSIARRISPFCASSPAVKVVRRSSRSRLTAVQPLRAVDTSCVMV